METYPQPTRFVSLRRITTSPIFFIMVVIIFCIGITLNEWYLPHQRFAGSKTIEIPSGYGSRMIADKLKQEGFIRSKWFFALFVTLRGEASLLKPGEYEFDNASIKTIAHELVGGNYAEAIITLPEGGTIDDLNTILQNQRIKTAGFNVFAKNPPDDVISTFPFARKAAATGGLEGYLFPDTYHLFLNATHKDIATAFLRNFSGKISPLQGDIQKSGHSLHDIIIMASMLEREVVSDHDRAIVAGILWKRLQHNIPLQVDATVLYAKKSSSGDDPTKTPLTRDDLLIDSPYNTYKYRGLPAGPIGNPGLSAIMASLYPTISPYLYYLSAPDGRTIFSRTLEEHNRAKRKYLTK